MNKGIVLGLVFLLVMMSFTSTSGNQINNQTIESSGRGNTLYVGGSGEGNYTKIQDAIDNASDGDTLFVFDDSSPYNEDVIINKRIMLVGEDKNTTLINGSESGEVVIITADNVFISGFMIHGYYAEGLTIFSNNNIVSNNIFSNCFKSINLGDSTSGNEIFQNTMNNSYSGIIFHKSSNNVIYNNLISNNDNGIFVWYHSLNNQIKNNTFESNRKLGIRLSTTSATVSGNIFSNNTAGLVLAYCSDNFIKNNCFINDGLYVHDSYRNIVENNTINEKPLLYLEGKSNMIIDDSAGQVFLVSCNNITVRNLEFSHACMGVGLVDTVDSKIENNIFSNVYEYAICIENSENIVIENNTIENLIEYCGIFTLYSHHNTINNNVINNSDSWGIHLGISDNNKIFGNNISNSRIGIYLFVECSNNTINNNKICNNQNGVIIGYIECENNTLLKNNIVNNNIGIEVQSNQNLIFGNSITDNDLGINIEFYSFNNIYHNNFINNSQNAYDKCNNSWDNGYPSGGNFWDDYTGEDDDGDGIGDTSYLIPGGDNEDRFPLMNPWVNTPPDAPIITGPTSGKPGVDYNYTFVTTDPDGDDIWYHISWGDKEILYIYGPYSSGEEITLSYNWSEKGTYIISCWTRDIYDAVSNITTLEVTIPRDKATNNLLLLRILERFPLLQRLLDVWRDITE